jgi:UDP-glucuronate decarboxylase
MLPCANIGPARNAMAAPPKTQAATEFTVLQLAEASVALTKSRSKLVQGTLPVDDPKQRQPDISLAREILNRKPKIELREGLTRTIEYFKSFI